MKQEDQDLWHKYHKLSNNAKKILKKLESDKFSEKDESEQDDESQQDAKSDQDDDASHYEAEESDEESTA